MAGKHTPKPWTIDRCKEDGRQWEISSKEWDALAVVFTSGSWEDDPEGKANALIMRAAPDMLDALKEIRDGLQSYLNLMLDMGLYVQVKLLQEKMIGLPAVVNAINLAEKGEE